MTTHYELYYNDGGHCGPFHSFKTAYEAALHRLNRYTTCIEIRHTSEPACVGGFAPNHPASFYVTHYHTTIH